MSDEFTSRAITQTVVSQTDIPPRFPDLSNPIWTGIQGIGTIIAILLSVLAIIVTIRVATKRKVLMYQILSQGPLPGLRSPAASTKIISLKLGRRVITNPDVVILKFANTGELPIEPSDYEMPIQVTFVDSNAHIYEAYTTESHPPSLQLNATANGGTVTLEKTLINDHNWFHLQIIGTQLSGPFRVEGYIKGVRSIDQFIEIDIGTDIAVPIVGFFLRPILFFFPRRFRRRIR
ncbi:MAG TPA: hypothetical protein VGE45_02055 [Chloroflexia bacterium]|jgi:hypothetical protein